MPLVLNSSGGGSITIAAPNTTSNLTLSVPAANATLITTASTGQVIPKAAMPIGSVIQTVVFRSQIGVSMTTNSYADTGYGATITPQSSSNKIMLTFSCTEMRSRGDVAANMQIQRNGSGISEIKELGYSGGAGGTQTTGSIGMAVSFTHIDSPASTSALTYQIYARKLTANAGNVEFLPNSTNSGWITIVLQEIVA